MTRAEDRVLTSKPMTCRGRQTHDRPPLLAETMARIGDHVLRCLTAVLTAALLLGTPLATSSAWAEPPSELDADRIDAYVEKYLKINGLPGASVAVVKDGEPVYEKGYGSDSTGKQITERSRMRIESVSKSFTAFAVLQLVQDDRIDLDHPVQEYLPGFRPDDPRGQQITVRQLLSHTSGLPSPTIVGPATTLDEGVARIQAWQLTSTPGTRYRYSNVNYWTAALLVQRVSGQDFSAYLQSHVFDPLEMADSLNTTTTTMPVDGLPRGQVTAYGGALPVQELEAMSSGAGGVVSTAHDMALWMAMQSKKGTTADGKELLAPELVKEAHTPQPNAGRSGLGWSRSGPGTTPERIQHSGAGSGYQAQQTLVPSHGYGIVVLLNNFTPTREHAYEIADGILTISDGDEPAVGAPVPTIIDLVLGALTLGITALGVRGTVRSPSWVTRRRHRGPVFFAARQIPQVIMPALAGLLFFVLPALENNSSTLADVFALYPAAMILVLVAALACLAQVVNRAIWRILDRRSPQGHAPRARSPLG